MYFVDEFLTVPDKNILILNTELTKTKIILVINLKWHNLDYPSYPVRRPHLTFPVTTKLYIRITWVEFLFTTTRIGRL